MASTSGPVVDVYLSSNFNIIPSCYSAIYRWHDKCNHNPQIWDKVVIKRKRKEWQNKKENTSKYYDFHMINCLQTVATIFHFLGNIVHIYLSFI